MTKDSELTRNEWTELFLLALRGNLAIAFTNSGVVPTNDEWCILRGVDDPTLRQIGEIGWRTGFDLDIAFRDPPAARPTTPGTGDGE